MPFRLRHRVSTKGASPSKDAQCIIHSFNAVPYIFLPLSLLVASSMSSGSCDSSEVTSDDYDDVLCRTGKEKVQFRKFQVHLENIGGDVVVGGQSAQKFRSRKKKGGEDHGLPKPSSNTNQPSGISTRNSSSKESSKHERAEERTRFIQSGEYIPGSYCQTTCDRRQYVQEKETWNPKPDKCIFKSKGDRKFPWTIQSFMDSPDGFIRDMHRSDGLSKERREEFILHVILKHLERYWGGCSSANEKVYRILGKIMSVDSNIVVKHTMHLLFHLICKDNLSNDTRNLMLVEKNLRTSLFSSEKGFERDLNAEQNFQLKVYGRVLSLLLVQRVRQQNLPTTTLEEDLTKVQEDVRKCCAKVENKRKDEFRYSLEFIDRMISLLLTPHDKLTAATKLNDFLKESEDFFINQTTDHTKRLKILDTYGKKKSGEWCVLHCILIFLHGEVQSERSVRQKETGRRAMILLRLIIETFLKEGDGAGDWRFCLLASSILAHIAMNNETIEIMKEAGSCLVNLLKDLVKMDKGRTRLECRTIVEQRALQLFFCPHSKTRTLLVNFLLNTLDVQDVVSADLHINHLMSCSEYRAQSLEISNDKIHTGQNCFIHKGMFQRRKVAIKMLWVTKQHLKEEDPKSPSRARLIQEAYNLTRLNNSHHFPNLLGYNTKDLPYHLVTDHETSGDLLHFLRESRKSIMHLPSVRLLKMIIDVINGLLYLQEKCLVHRAVMAENVLVGESYVCKLSGLYALKKLSYGTSEKGATSAATYDYCSADDGVPDYISADDEDEELPVRWKAPECITMHRYSTASDTWAFGILMYEVFTYGCIPYKHISDDKEVASHVVEAGGIVPHETCIEEKKFELIKKSCDRQIHKRNSLIELKESLQNMLTDADENEPGPEPPSWDFENQQDEAIYSVIPGKEEYLLQKGDCPYNKEDKGSIWICERITKLDIKHLKSLRKLNNPNLANILIKHWDSHPPVVEITSLASTLGNLKDYVVKRRCQQESIVTFLSQVASALHYLHTKHIVHGDLRAMYVMVVSPDQVQVGRLGRSKSLSPSPYEVTSKSCVVKAEMPSDASRWSAPEVNLDGYYTHASDVWAFGIMAWELYVSFISGEDLQPYYHLQEDQILMHMRHKGPEGQLERPEGCPDWVYILMHQCWAYDFAQRPPFLAIFDCLTSREPMKSWIMELWLQNHKEREWPLDLSICQQNALHVTNAKRDHTTEDIISMCPVSFFAKHNYKYVETASASYSVDDEYYASCSSEGGSLDRRLEYHDTADGRRTATFFRDTEECRGGYEEPIVSTYCETSGEKKGIESCQNAFTVPLNPKSQTEAPFYESVELPLSNEQLLAPMHNKSIVSRDTTTTITSTSVAEKTDGFEKSLKTMPNGSSGHLSPLEKYSDKGNLSKSLPVKESRSSRLFYSSTVVSQSTRSHSGNFKGCSDDANRPMGGMGRIEAQPTSKHNYKYVETASASYGVDDEYYASCSSEGGSLDRRLEYHDTTDGRITATFFRDTGECRGGYEEPIVSTYCETSGEKKGIESCQNAFTVPLNPKSQTENPLYESVDLPLSNEQLLAPMHNKSIVSRDTAKTITSTLVAEKTDGFEKSLKTMPNGSSSYLSPLEKYSDRGNLSKSLPVKESRSSSLFYSSTDVSPSTRSHSVNFKGCSDDAIRPVGGMGRIEAQPTSIANASNCSNPENMKYNVPSTPIKLKNTTLPEPCSVEKTKSTKRTKRNWTDSVHYSSVELVGSTLNCENGNSSKTENSATYAGLHECCSAEYQVLISNLSNVQSHKSEADNDYDDVLDEDQTILKNKDDHFIYDDVISFPVNGGEVVNSGFNKKDDSLIADFPNRAVRLEQKNVSDNPRRDAKEDMNTAQYQKVKSLDHDGNSMNGKIQRNSLDNKHLRQCQNKTEVASGAVCPISTKMPQRAEHNSDPCESGQSMAGPVNQEDDIVRYKLQRNTASNEHTFINNYENFSCDLDQGDNSNSMRRNTERKEGYNKYVDCETESQFSSNQSNARNCSYENATYYLATPPSQLSTGARKISSGSQAKRKSKSCQKRHKEKTDADRTSAVEDMHSTSERPMQNQSLMARLNDPELNIIQF